MSLRARVIVLIGLVLCSSLAAGLCLAGLEVRRAIHEELAAALQGGRQTIASAFEDLPRSDHQPRDLRQLAATFDGNRHVQAFLVAPDGRILFRSRLDRPEHPAPAMFVRVFGQTPSAVTIPVPATATARGAIRLTPSADLDLAAVWAELIGVVAVFIAATALALIGAYWAIGQALAPLDEMAAAFRAIGRGDYHPRIRERGPPEVLLLERGFNSMAADLAATNARNRRLEDQLSTIQDEERAELARDLHDEIGPHLFAVNVDAQIVGQAAARGDSAVIAERLASIRNSVAHMQRLVREILGRLRPTRAADLGLAGAVADLVDECRNRHPGIDFDLDLGDRIDSLPPRQTETVYRVVQESLSNALRHSTPGRVAISARAGGEDAVVLEVSNDGAPADSRGGPGGFGLIGMRERVSACGGDLEVSRRSDEWIIRVRLPVTTGDQPVAGASVT